MTTIEKAVYLLRAGKARLLIAVPLYRCWWRLRGLDFHAVSIQKLKLNPERAKECKDGGGPLLQDFLNQLSITESDCVLDLGSGKGGAMVTLAKYPFKCVDGVEICPELVEISRRNFARLGLVRCRVFHADAAEYVELDPYTYIFMFNPFTAGVLRQALKNIEESLRRAPRVLRILYSNPVDEKTLLESGTFKRTMVYQPYPDYLICAYENGSHLRK